MPNSVAVPVRFARWRRGVRAAAIVAGSLLLPGVLVAQLGPDSLEQIRVALVAADGAAGDLASRQGLARALSAVGSGDVVLVYPGAPVLAGREAAVAFLESQASTGASAVGWSPLHAEVSADGSFGVTYGVTGIVGGTGAEIPIRFGNYLSAWRRTAEGWRLVAHAQLFFPSPSSVTMPPGFQPPQPPPLDWSHPSVGFAVADSGFAALAGLEGAERAFTGYAAADAVTFSPRGVLTRGPEAIGRGVRDDGAPSHWRWRPVAAGGSDGGDLGFTVGEAEIRPGDATGEGSVYYGKYLTLWRRDAAGKVRFLADGGSSRPVPVRP
jgi:ketosteroid isomerase-like protein